MRSHDQVLHIQGGCIGALLLLVRVQTGYVDTCVSDERRLVGFPERPGCVVGTRMRGIASGPKAAALSRNKARVKRQLSFAPPPALAGSSNSAARGRVFTHPLVATPSPLVRVGTPSSLSSLVSIPATARHGSRAPSKDRLSESSKIPFFPDLETNCLRRIYPR